MQAEHLRLLERAHAAMRAGHEDTHALFAAHGVFGRTAGVATGGTQDVELLATARQFVFEQVAQQLHRHVLERQCGAVGQRFKVQTAFEPLQRHDFLRAKHVLRVGLEADRLQVGGRNVVNVKRQHLKCQRTVALLKIDFSPGSQRGAGDLRIVLGQVQTAVRGQTFEQDFTEAFVIGMTTSGQITHSCKLISINQAISRRIPDTRFLKLSDRWLFRSRWAPMARDPPTF